MNIFPNAIGMYSRVYMPSGVGERIIALVTRLIILISSHRSAKHIMNTTNTDDAKRSASVSSTSRVDEAKLMQTRWNLVSSLIQRNANDILSYIDSQLLLSSNSSSSSSSSTTSTGHSDEPHKLAWYVLSLCNRRLLFMTTPLSLHDCLIIDFTYQIFHWLMCIYSIKGDAS
jgi:hypothetical protein